MNTLEYDDLLKRATNLRKYLDEAMSVLNEIHPSHFNIHKTNNKLANLRNSMYMQSVYYDCDGNCGVPGCCVDSRC